MEIPSIGQISSFQQSATRQKISTAVAVKANDAAKAQGEMILKLLDAASEAVGNGNQTGGSPSRLDVVG